MNSTLLFFVKYIFIVLIFIFGCASQKKIQYDGEPIRVERDKEQILFQTFSISKQGEKNVIALVNQIVTYGTLKPNITKDIRLVPGCLRYAMLDKDNNILDSILFPNLLKNNVEFVDDDGRLDRKTIDLDRAEFTVRMKLHPKTLFIEIVQFDSLGYKQLFLTKTM